MNSTEKLIRTVELRRIMAGHALIINGGIDKETGRDFAKVPFTRFCASQEEYDRISNSAKSKGYAVSNYSAEMRVADEYCKILKGWLSAEQWAEIISGKSDPDDFCDGNMAMAEALQNVFLKTEDQICDEACTEGSETQRIWNAAYDLARKAWHN